MISRLLKFFGNVTGARRRRYERLRAWHASKEWDEKQAALLLAKRYAKTPEEAYQAKCEYGRIEQYRWFVIGFWIGDRPKVQ
jgi:hypothetical protein